MHRAEFINAERFAVKSNTLLKVKYRTGAVEFYPDSDQQKDRGEDEYKSQAKNNVHYALHL
jgi:hypothetical protein